MVILIQRPRFLACTPTLQNTKQIIKDYANYGIEEHKKYHPSNILTMGLYLQWVISAKNMSMTRSKTNISGLQSAKETEEKQKKKFLSQYLIAVSNFLNKFYLHPSINPPTQEHDFLISYPNFPTFSVISSDNFAQNCFICSDNFLGHHIFCKVVLSVLLFLEICMIL